ncbi:MAG: outer membrane lipid asymmetry maintenance protein MlaD [Deltaproteobacteria bacterium]|nr:outer membrane lipid asymmetry maintenance protein MlaD [Deltaproteobacteria bacterium]
MNDSKKLDWIVGLFVLAGLAAIAVLSFSVGGASYSGRGGLPLYATFDEIGGLKDRAPIMIAGVKVGKVERIELDGDYRARIKIDIDDTLELPVDSSAAIRTAGLLGDQFIHIELGAEEEILVAGEEIAYTEDALVIESLIGKLVHNLGMNKDE